MKDNHLQELSLLDVFRRNMEPKAWEEGDKIPWDSPTFGRRMLKEHLSQKHDAASRRTRVINKHVAWIHNHLLDKKPSRLLDLCCGPGLYASRLAKLGHVCHGIDFSPASIEYASKNAPEGCTYALSDVRTADYGSNYDFVMLIYGEFNVFRPADARLILQKANASLVAGGKLLLEISSFDAVYQMGNQPATWYTAEKELFSEEPYLCLMESFWEEDGKIATERYYIVDATHSTVSRYITTTQAYKDSSLMSMLRKAGFREVTTFPSMAKKNGVQASPLAVFLAEK